MVQLRFNASKGVIFYSLLFIFAFLILSIGIFQKPNSFDEGLIDMGSLRVVAGQIPYKDFWTGYGPGQFYLLAGIFKIFGASILVARIWDIIVLSLMLLFIYKICRTLSSARIAFLIWALALLWLAHFKLPAYRFYNYPPFSAMFFCFLSIMFFIAYFEKRQTARYLLAAGICVGISSLFRHDFGIYIFSGECLTLSVFSLFKTGFGQKGSKSPSFRELLRINAYYIFGISIIILPILIYFLKSVSLKDIAYDLIIFPFSIYRRFRYFPGPQLINDLLQFYKGEISFWDFWRIFIHGLPYYFSIVIFISMAVLIAKSYCKNRSVELGRNATLAMIVFLGITFLIHARVRFDPVHLFPAFICALILSAWLLKKLLNPNKPELLPILALMCFFITLLFLNPLEEKLKFIFNSKELRPDYSHGVKRALGVHLDPSQAACISYIQRHSRVDEPIYVGNFRHDRIFLNDIMFYFLSERPSATRYEELHPGVATTRPIQEEIINELKVKRVGYVVLVRCRLDDEPNESSRSSHVIVLDEYIRDNYSKVQQSENYEILKRE